MTDAREPLTQEYLSALQKMLNDGFFYVAYKQPIRNLLDEIERLNKLVGYLSRQEGAFRMELAQLSTELAVLKANQNHADYRDCLEVAGAIADSVECYEGDDLLSQIIPHLQPLIGVVEPMSDEEADEFAKSVGIVQRDYLKDFAFELERQVLEVRRYLANPKVAARLAAEKGDSTT